LTAAALLILSGLTLTAGGAGADEHLLAGAQRFREAHYPEALVEFRVAQRLGSGEAARYAAVTLVKLGRPEEAIEAFGGLGGREPDALIDYHRAVAAFDARLYLAADRILGTVADRAGPKVGAEAARMRAEIAATLKVEPTPVAIDWYLHRCDERRAQGRAMLAAAYCREAAGLSARRPDHYKQEEALRGTQAAARGAKP